MFQKNGFLVLLALVVLTMAAACSVPISAAQQPTAEPPREPIVLPTNTPRPTPTAVPPLPTATVSIIVPTLVPVTPTPQTNACVSGAEILSPRDGANFQVGDTIVISGTATMKDFSYYKIQYQTVLTTEPDLWAEAYRSEEHPDRPYLPPTPIPEPSVLARWNTSGVEPGTYRARLVVNDTASNYVTPCVITLTLAGASQ
jgi:hypothetical protein